MRSYWQSYLWKKREHMDTGCKKSDRRIGIDIVSGFAKASER